MINNSEVYKEVHDMSKAKSSNDIWDEIIDSLVLETEPPTKYIKDAVIVTKNGASYRVSANDFADLCAREKMIPPEQSEIQHCSVSIDFARIKRDVNKWSCTLIDNIEKSFPSINLGTKTSKAKKAPAKKATVKKTATVKKRKVD